MQNTSISIHDIVRRAVRLQQPGTSVAGCLAYPGMTQVPERYDALVQADFAELSAADEALDWEDYCPAYALGLLTYQAYYRDASRVGESELHDQWDELRGVSRLNWLQAQTVIARAWSALAQLEREGRLYQHAVS